MRVLFIFLDGIGLGTDDPSTNPFARAEMPRLEGPPGRAKTPGGIRAVRRSARQLCWRWTRPWAWKGLPQSATGQAVLLTGVNIPAETGEHYGPKPNPAVAEYLLEREPFLEIARIRQNGRAAQRLSAALLSRRRFGQATLLLDPIGGHLRGPAALQQG